MSPLWGCGRLSQMPLYKWKINKSWEPLNRNKRCTALCLVAHVRQKSRAISQLFDIVHVFVKSLLCMCEQEGGQKVVPLIICPARPLFFVSSQLFTYHTAAAAYIASQIVFTL